MKIGELSRRTGASARSLRYYENLGLISSDRQPNGYRDYDAATVAEVETIKSLLGLGFPTAVIGEVISCDRIGESEGCEVVRSRVAELRDEMATRADELVRRRDALAASLVATDRSDAFAAR